MLDPSIEFCYNLSVKTIVHSNNNVVYNCHYHIVFCPKYRRKVLVSPIDTRLKALIQECVEKWQQEFVEIDVMPDHVHLIVGCDPQFGIHKLIRYIKGSSSHYLREEFPELKRKIPSLWTNSYYVGTVGGVTIETVKRYVEGQKGK